MQTMNTPAPPALAKSTRSDARRSWLIRNGRLSFQPVKLGEVFKDQVALCDGLEAGDKIVAAGVQRLQEGQLVGGMDQ